ncbi:zinc finger MYM-type protein 4-like [Thalassophryne amazonica]|uniref:zinc finger MYM-type protein 4-like n=1 Tax=Thalassophryne amazonica TaxID=390379 RepID=UPI0014721808|nr:zinc finger MYM-type protein 4-like [Thalassophryne amazonica]
MVPVPVPVFIPVPMNMYSQKTPVPMAMPMPVPVPLVVPPQKKEVSDVAVQSEPVHVEEDKQKVLPIASEDQDSSHPREIDPEEMTPIISEDNEPEKQECTVQRNEKEECIEQAEENEHSSKQISEKEERTTQRDEKLRFTIQTDEKEECTVQTDEKEECTVQTDEKEKCTVQTDEKEECTVQTDEKEKCTVQTDEKEECTVQTDEKEKCTVQTDEKEKSTVQTDEKEECTVQTDEKEKCTVQTDEKQECSQQPDQQPTIYSVGSTEATDPKISAQPEESMITSEPPSTSIEHDSPSSPMMDLETELPTVLLDQKRSTPQRGVKRPREGSSGRKRSRRRTASLDRRAVKSPAGSKLNHLYGVKAWKNWVQQCHAQPQGSHSLDVKEDILQCDSAQLSVALSRFVRQVRRPNGETYSPDSIFYLCLGIQQYLFIKGRIENIFTDELYSQFAKEITGMLRLWKPKLQAGGGVISSRVEESYLWECKQLGAYSPIVLLNTLLFFCTKSFGFTTLAQHRKLSFANFSRQSKPCSRTGKVQCLRYLKSAVGPTTREETERTRKKQEEMGGDMEMLENTANPLHCPVRLYEFYLSRCPESAKKRYDVFYLQPERNVNTQSSLWFTSQPLESSTLQSMLTRILAVREVQQKQEAALQQPAATSSAANDGVH